MNDYEHKCLVALANDIIEETNKQREAPELFDNASSKEIKNETIENIS